MTTFDVAMSVTSGTPRFFARIAATREVAWFNERVGAAGPVR